MKKLFENLKRRIHKKEKTPEEHLKAVFELTKDVELDMKELEKQAREHPDRMIFQDVKNPKEYQLRSHVLHFLMIGDYRKAIQYATEGIEINPESAYLFYIRGRSKGYTNLFDEGIKDLNQAIKLKPDYADAFVERGYIKQKGSDIKGAEEDYQKAREIDPSVELPEEEIVIPSGLTFK